MGKKTKGGPDLGKLLIKDRFGGGKMRGKKMVEKNSMLHTTEIQDGYDWGRLNLQSVTEESSFQEFLSTAELAGTEFQGEKMNVSFVGCHTNAGVLSLDETKKIKSEHEQNKDCLKIPRRPRWTSETTADELQLLERTQFLEWRRTLAVLQENQGLLLTPFEKNLEFWRQLWRVVERSDVVVQIVDARNPLLFWCEDLEKYVKEVSEDKLNLILINKSDFLNEQQRQIWADYFSEKKIKVAFFSAIEEEPLENIEENDGSDENPEENDSSDSEEEIVNSETNLEKDVNKLDNAVQVTADKLSEIQNEITKIILENKLVDEPSTSKKNDFNSPDLLTRIDLIELFRKIHTGKKVTENVTTIGLVGYPNVGKSSTINSLLLEKKVSVSATPGKTKHFQTIYLDTDLLLCDCPGLVMPSFVVTKAEMVINGILPIDQMRDHIGPVTLVTSLIPRHIFVEKYGVMLPISEDEVELRPPTSEELLNAYGYIRGYMTANGQPDNPRSARYILKDFVNGKLLHCHAPPTIEQSVFHTFSEPSNAPPRPMPPRERRAIKLNNISGADIDKVFFKEESKGFHARGVAGKASGVPETSSTTAQQGKPWKQINKHANKKKREKARRIYAHLDQH